MSKTFGTWDVDQFQIFPPSVHDFVPLRYEAQFIRDLVRSELDLSADSRQLRVGPGA